MTENSKTDNWATKPSILDNPNRIGAKPQPTCSHGRPLTSPCPTCPHGTRV